MESSRDAGLQAFRETIAQLERLVPLTRLDEPLTLHAITPYPQSLGTTFGREV